LTTLPRHGQSQVPLPGCNEDAQTIVKAGSFIPSIVAILSFQVSSSFSSALPDRMATKNADVRSANRGDGQAGCWNVIFSPNANQNMHDLDAVTGSGNNVWAVGNYDLFGLGDFRTLTIHWDGSAWSLIPSPNPGDFRDYLFGATGSGNDVWAVGMYNNHGDQLGRNWWRDMQPDGIPPGGPGMTLTLHRNGIVIATVPNTGTYTDSTGDTGRARYTYKVCEAGTQACSNNARVTFR
jgi:hypothetical protein